ncbi:MAG TPA: thiamine phosphate synthase [Burkholderiales bacterium]|nr:thiamine phosphate synthase [Burkholderiales bacterium]
MNPARASAEARAAAPAAIAGLYAITPDEADTAVLARKVGEAIAGGARAVQYRNKSADARLRREQGVALLPLCRSLRVPLIINDDLDLAVSLGADGLHLGRDDASVVAARARLGPGRMLGASCYDRLDLALAARRDGADYVAFGSAFASSIKPGAGRAPLSLYREAKARLACPVVAIGGISRENARLVIDAGADAVAVISALFDGPDIEQRAREFARMFN